MDHHDEPPGALRPLPGKADVRTRGLRPWSRWTPAIAAGLTALVVVGATVAVTSVHHAAGPHVPGPSRTPTPSISPVSLAGAVPWVNRPGEPLEPSPLPTRPPATDARPCRGSDVRVSPDGGNGAGGHTALTFAFRNVSHGTCILQGFPRLVAAEPGRPDLLASRGGFLVGTEARTANMAPGGTTYLNVETERDCPAAYSSPPAERKVYHRITIEIPGGGRKFLQVAEGFDVLCGLFVGPFTVPMPPPRYAQSPLHDARAALELPSAVAAGSILHYVVSLANPTDRDIKLTPCPSYIQHGSDFGVPIKQLYQLNCAGAGVIPVHRAVRYEMRLAVPASAPDGTAVLSWEELAFSNVGARGTVRILGRQASCDVSTLSPTIPAAAVVHDTLMHFKGQTTTVALRLVNTSTRPCSLYERPSFRLLDPAGHDLGAPFQDHRPQQDQAVTLAPRSAATATLYWSLGWCGKPAHAVEVTLPNGGGRVTVVPAHGWTPPRCEFGGAGVLAADGFRAAG